MRDNLTSEVDFATLENSTPDEPTQIIEWDFEDGTRTTIEEGNPLVFDAQDIGASDLPADTRFALAKVRPDSDLEIGETFVEFSVRPFNSLTLAQQQSGDNADRRRLEFDPQAQAVNNGTVEFTGSDKAKLYVLSSEEVDGSTIRFDYDARVTDI